MLFTPSDFLVLLYVLLCFYVVMVRRSNQKKLGTEREQFAYRLQPITEGSLGSGSVQKFEAEATQE